MRQCGAPLHALPRRHATHDPPAEGKKAKAAVESNVGIENARNALKAVC